MIVLISLIFVGLVNLKTEICNDKNILYTHILGNYKSYNYHEIKN